MDLENNPRHDASPYERGLSYGRWIRAGYFRSQEDLAQTLKISRSQVSRLLKLARLPNVIVEAFHSAADICETWGLELLKAMETSSARPQMLEAARVIASVSPRPSAGEVFRRLQAAGSHCGSPAARARKDRVAGRGERPLFQIKHKIKVITLELPIENLSARRLDEIKVAIACILQKHGSDEANGSAGRRGERPLR